MSTMTASKLTRQDYDDLHDAIASPGDYRAMVSAMFEAVERIVSRHVDEAVSPMGTNELGEPCSCLTCISNGSAR